MRKTLIAKKMIIILSKVLPIVRKTHLIVIRMQLKVKTTLKKTIKIRIMARKIHIITLKKEIQAI